MHARAVVVRCVRVLCVACISARQQFASNTSCFESIQVTEWIVSALPMSPTLRRKQKPFQHFTLYFNFAKSDGFIHPHKSSLYEHACIDPNPCILRLPLKTQTNRIVRRTFILVQTSTQGRRTSRYVWKVNRLGRALLRRRHVMFVSCSV